MGSKITILVELMAVNGRRAEFRVEARLGEKIIGEGTHQRAIIEVARFAEKVANTG
jgi:fluoroacetyl-CoA thioesterase